MTNTHYTHLEILILRFVARALEIGHRVFTSECEEAIHFLRTLLESSSDTSP